MQLYRCLRNAKTHIYPKGNIELAIIAQCSEHNIKCRFHVYTEHNYIPWLGGGVGMFPGSPCKASSILATSTELVVKKAMGVLT